MASQQENLPMLEQYRRIKKEHKDAVLFFRLGDFYEMFAEDAIEVSALLNLTLTQRTGLPMCGVPHHAYRAYIARLLRYGKKVAVCEQLGEASKGKGIIERKVVEVISPGTTVDEDFLQQGSANHLAAFASEGSASGSGRSKLSFAYIDLSTGEFAATAFPLADCAARLRLELERLDVKEVLLEESLLEELPDIAEAFAERQGIVVNRWAAWLFDLHRSRDRLVDQFGEGALKSFGLKEDSAEQIAAGALLDYLQTTAQSLLPHVQSLHVYDNSEFVGIDENSLRNLELVRNLRDGSDAFTLYSVMNETRTAMGNRLLKYRILHPLREIKEINARLASTESLFRNQAVLSRLREILKKAPDLERLCSRLGMDKAHGKDMLSLRNALQLFEEIEGLVAPLGLIYEGFVGAGRALPLQTPPLQNLKELLEESIHDDPSILLNEGNLIKEGYNKELDQLRFLHDNSRVMLDQYLEEERMQTGISSLKIRYNRLIGYFFEVTKAHVAKIPKHFIKRQGIVTAERFTTVRLQEIESEINGASEKLIELEKNLFLEIRDKAKAEIPGLLAIAKIIAETDIFQSNARAATVHLWRRPLVHQGDEIKILEGRHPVVELGMRAGEFIPNDLLIGDAGSKKQASFILITGPNMAGKSTYLRQTALITLMAQMGSFVPAETAEIGIVDKVYCRVGASDNLARGESTFLTEMNETAYILHTATKKSLVIMDEVGRGTGTNDGLSIAWAVSEDLLNRVQCKTLFATHYHELAGIKHPSLKNLSMDVIDDHGEIIFLRKIKEGPSNKSYGIHVARLAGLPESVLERATTIMEELDGETSFEGGFDKLNHRGSSSRGQRIHASRGSRLIPTPEPPTAHKPLQAPSPGLFEDLP